MDTVSAHLLLSIARAYEQACVHDHSTWVVVLLISVCASSSEAEVYHVANLGASCDSSCQGRAMVCDPAALGGHVQPQHAHCLLLMTRHWLPHVLTVQDPRRSWNEPVNV